MDVRLGVDAGGDPVDFVYRHGQRRYTCAATQDTP